MNPCRGLVAAIVASVLLASPPTSGGEVVVKRERAERGVQVPCSQAWAWSTRVTRHGELSSAFRFRISGAGVATIAVGEPGAPSWYVDRVRTPAAGDYGLTYTERLPLFAAGKTLRIRITTRTATCTRSWDSTVDVPLRLTPPPIIG